VNWNSLGVAAATVTTDSEVDAIAACTFTAGTLADMASAGYRAKIDWDEAFAFYAGLGPTRTYGEVASKYGVSEAAVRKRAVGNSGGTWRERAETIDQQAAKKAEAWVIRDRAERIADTIRIVEGARLRFAQQLGDPEFTISASGLVDLVKLEQLLEGNPTERHASGLDGLLGRLKLAVQGDALERALAAGDLEAARRALEKGQQ
jgi:hypothetical protein